MHFNTIILLLLIHYYTCFNFIFCIALNHFANFLRFFLWDLSSSCIVILHLITLKRLRLESPLSQLYVAKTDLNYLSWFIFYNICCPKSKKLANIFLTILFTVKKRNLLSFKAQKWFKISKKVTIFEISMTILLPVSAEKVKQKKFKQMCTFNAL